jgi:hypothetical protein
MAGYYKMPEQTAALSMPTAGCTPATWRTARRRKLVYRGRLKEMTAGGFNVATLEVEEFIKPPACARWRWSASPTRAPAKRAMRSSSAPGADLDAQRIIGYCR